MKLMPKKCQMGFTKNSLRSQIMLPGFYDAKQSLGEKNTHNKIAL